MCHKRKEKIWWLYKTKEFYQGNLSYVFKGIYMQKADKEIVLMGLQGKGYKDKAL